MPAGGQPDAVAALGRLYGIHAERIEAANAEVLRRLDGGTPLLTGVTTVAAAAPGLAGRTLLHCGPAIGYADAPDPLQRSMRAAAVAEGWADSLEQADERLAREEIGLAPANEHAVVVPMATASSSEVISQGIALSGARRLAAKRRSIACGSSARQPMP